MRMEEYIPLADYTSHVLSLFDSLSLLLPFLVTISSQAHTDTSQHPSGSLIDLIGYSAFTGFDRSIPGYPRYSMTGNPQDGVHNLKIDDARIEDDGEYQCQIGPSINSKAIRANSRVTVLSKYPSPSLVYLFVRFMSDCLLWKLLVIRLFPYSRLNGERKTCRRKLDIKM